jgi:Tfp pilus assembly protein PilV
MYTKLQTEIEQYKNARCGNCTICSHVGTFGVWCVRNRCKHHLAEQGVVLLEAVVAIGILALLLSSVLSLMTRATSAMYTSSDQLTATYLAHDVLEWARARKAFNENSGSADWYAGIGVDASGVSVCTPSGLCGVDTTTQQVFVRDFAQCSVFDCRVYTSGAGGYLYYQRIPLAGDFQTPFTRTVVVETNDLYGDANPDELELTVAVTWRSSSGAEHRIEASSFLYKSN